MCGSSSLVGGRALDGRRKDFCCLHINVECKCYNTYVQCTCANCKTLFYIVLMHIIYVKKLVLPHFAQSKRDWNFGFRLCMGVYKKLFGCFLQLAWRKKLAKLQAKLQHYFWIHLLPHILRLLGINVLRDMFKWEEMKWLIYSLRRSGFQRFFKSIYSFKNIAQLGWLNNSIYKTRYGNLTIDF